MTSYRSFFQSEIFAKKKATVGHTFVQDSMNTAKHSTNANGAGDDQGNE